MTTLDLDAVTELERSQNSYIAKMSDGHNSIIVRSKDDELAECYRLMGAAAARLRQLTDENDRWQEEARQYAENADYWRDRLNDHKASLAIQAFTAPDEDEAVMMESLVARIGDLLAERDEYRRQLDTLRNASDVKDACPRCGSTKCLFDDHGGRTVGTAGTSLPWTPRRAEMSSDRTPAEILRELAQQWDDHAVIQTDDATVSAALNLAADTLDALTPAPPDQAMETARLTITSYIRDDGSNGYQVHAKGDVPMTTYLGLTVIAQREIERWSDG